MFALKHDDALPSKEYPLIELLLPQSIDLFRENESGEKKYPSESNWNIVDDGIIRRTSARFEFPSSKWHRVVLGV